MKKIFGNAALGTVAMLIGTMSYDFAFNDFMVFKFIGKTITSFNVIDFVTKKYLEYEKNKETENI